MGHGTAGCAIELHTAGDSLVTTTTVERMADLWKLETERRGQSPEARAAARQAISVPIVAELFALWQHTLPRISGKSKLTEAIRHAVARREIFERFLTDGLIELDPNIVARAIRPQTVTRNNSLFEGDLPPVGPSIITRVCRFEIGSRRVVSWRARRALSHQGAQASGALGAASGCRARRAA